ncbi:MAG: TonB-dependent receptor, partial [Veillonella sp.]|nr:TonB-dependent receptor [Veillonella sp.]
ITFNKNYNLANGLPSADHNRKFGSPGTFRHVTEKYGVARYESDFTKNVSAYAAFGMRETKMDYLYNEFRLNNLNLDRNGSASVQYRYNNQVNKANSGEIGIKGQFNRGGFDNEVTLAANRYEWKRYMANRLSTDKYYATSFNNPAWRSNNTWATSQGWEEPLNDKNILTGLSLTDVITTPDKQWTFILGGRYQNIKQTSYKTPFSSSSGTYEKHAFSPAVGVVRKVNDHMSFYANYMEGLSAGDIVGSGYDNENTLLAPQKTKQVEVGAKWETAKTLTTLSLFQMRQDATMDVVSDGPYGKSLTNDGQVRNRGIELSVAGEPKEGTRVMGSLMYLDAKYTAGNANVGNTYMGTPHWQAVARVEQDIKSVKGLSVSARANYQGSAYVDAANTAKVGGRVTWDLGAKYKFNGLGNHPMTLRADVYNVFNKD